MTVTAHSNRRADPEQRVGRDRQEPAQPDVDDVADDREHREQVQERHALEQRKKLLRPGQDEDDQCADAREREHGLSTIAPGMLLPTMGAREQLAAALFGSGVLGALMRLRRLAPVPTTVSILTYHHIADEDPTYGFDPGVADATPAQFKRQLELVARYGTPISIEQLVRALEGDPLPQNAVMITFDDGYRSCHDVALPLLHEVGLPACSSSRRRSSASAGCTGGSASRSCCSSTRLPSATIAYPELRSITAHDPMALRNLADLVKDTPNLDLERFLGELAHAFRVDWDAAIEQRHAETS